MKIVKKLNNNAVIAKDDHHVDVVVTGRGIAYNKGVFDDIDPERILQVYVPKSRQQRNKFELMVSEIPIEFFVVAERIVALARRELAVPLDDGLSLRLADHLHYASVKRERGVVTPNLMRDEIRRFYPREYRVALDAVAQANELLGTAFDDDEAGFIAFHIASSEDGGDMLDLESLIELMRDIVADIEQAFHLAMDEDSLEYARLITHLKYFLIKARGSGGGARAAARRHDLQGDQLYQILRDKYRDVDAYLDRIDARTRERWGYRMTDEDRMYLLIHLVRIIAA